MVNIVERKLDCCLLETPEIADNRGWFNVALNVDEIHYLGLDFKTVCQLNHSYTREAGVVRGPNYQKAPFSQSKLVRCIRGSLYSVGIELDAESKNYGKWCGFVLSEQDHNMMYLPRSYAHGFITLEKNTELEYFTDEKYDYSSAKSFQFDDPAIGIDWTMNGKIQIRKDILSDKNRYAPPFKDHEF